MQALIHIKGTQILEEQEPDTIELTTCGTFQPTESGYALSYTEGQGEDSTEVTLHIAGNRVTLERTGSRSSILILEKQRRHHSQYSTPYGVLDMGTYATAHKLQNAFEKHALITDVRRISGKTEAHCSRDRLEVSRRQ